MRFSLHTGVWSGSISLILGGVFAVLSAATGQEALALAGWISIVAGVILAAWGVKVDGEHWWARGRARMIMSYGLIAVSLVGLVFGVALAMRGGPSVPPEAVTPQSEPVSPVQITRIVVECSHIGDFENISGPYSALLVFPNPPEHGGATGMATVGAGGSAKAGELGISHKCKLTNFGSAALINVRIPLRLSFHNAKITHQKGGGATMETGDLTLERDGLLVVPTLGVGPLESFTFYLENNSTQIAGVDFPDKAEAQRADRMNREVVAVSTTMNYPVVAFPKVEKIS